MTLTQVTFRSVRSFELDRQATRQVVSRKSTFRLLAFAWSLLRGVTLGRLCNSTHAPPVCGPYLNNYCTSAIAINILQQEHN